MVEVFCMRKWRWRGDCVQRAEQSAVCVAESGRRSEGSTVRFDSFADETLGWANALRE
jgi:hypothetical protein